MMLGNVASGKHFFNRTAELDNIWDKVEHNHIVMDGPRRLGKTSILYKLKEQSAQYRFNGVIIDVEDQNTAEGFIQCLQTAFATTGDKILSKLPKIKKVDGKLAGISGGVEFKERQALSWQQQGDKLMAKLTTKPHLVLIDEFSVFLNQLIKQDVEEAQIFLAWFRHWRQNPQIKCRFLLSGSIGLYSLLEQHGLQTWVNDCHHQQLGPFKQRHAIEMLQTQAQNKQLSLPDALAGYICNRIGWLSPYFLNLMLDKTIEAGCDRSGELTTLTGPDVDAAYEDLMKERAHFSHWLKRLKQQLPNPGEHDCCIALLTMIAKAEDGLTLAALTARLDDKLANEEMLSTLLLKLNEEGYISAANEQGRFQFLSFLVRDYWKRNHV